MRYVGIMDVAAGMKVAKAILNEKGDILVHANVMLTEPLIQQMRKRELTGIYIEDALSEDIFLEELISEDTERKAVKALQNLDIDAAMDVAELIVDEITDMSEISLDMSSLRSKSNSTYEHSIDVSIYAVMIGIGMGMRKGLLKELAVSALLHDIGKSIDHEVEGSHIQIGADLCKKYKESQIVINTVESHHGDVEPQSLIACIVQAADAISAARPGARRETLETYTNRLKQLEDITNSFKGVEKSFAIQAGREVRIMVVPEQVSDSEMVLLARDISKQIEAELEYPGQIKVNVIRESRVTDYAK